MSGLLPPRKIAPRKIAPRTIALWMIAPRKIASEDNCPRRKLSPRTIAPRTISPMENYPRGKLPPRIIVPSDNCPLDDCARKITSKIIAPWQYPHGNCSWVPFGWFVLRNIVPRVNYTRYIFSPKIKNRSTLIDSCFLLFSFFVV